MIPRARSRRAIVLSCITPRQRGRMGLAYLAPLLPERALAEAAAEDHLAAALPQLAGDYMGEHWLQSFALLASLAASCPSR